MISARITVDELHAVLAQRITDCLEEHGFPLGTVDDLDIREWVRKNASNLEAFDVIAAAFRSVHDELLEQMASGS